MWFVQFMGLHWFFVLVDPIYNSCNFPSLCVLIVELIGKLHIKIIQFLLLEESRNVRLLEMCKLSDVKGWDSQTQNLSFSTGSLTITRAPLILSLSQCILDFFASPAQFQPSWKILVRPSCLLFSSSTWQRKKAQASPWSNTAACAKKRCAQLQHIIHAYITPHIYLRSSWVLIVFESGYVT